MIRKRRTPTPDPATLERRSRWAGALTPELTDREREALRDHRRDSCVPDRAVGYLWDHWDPHHGDGWLLSAFESALAEDVAEIDQTLERYQEQRNRLTEWIREVERLAVERSSGPGAREMAEVYTVLSTLGYQGNYSEGKQGGSDDV